MEKSDAWLLTDELHVQQGQTDPFSAVIRATRMPIILTDPTQPDNPIIYANDAFLQMTGYSRDEVTGNNCRFLQGPNTDIKTVSKIRDAIKNKTDVSADILNYRKDGTAFWNALYLSPVPDADGVPQYFFALQADISERKADEAKMHDLQQKLKIRTAELEESLARRNLLLHEVDHRIRNNLQMICAMITLQMLGSENTEQNKSLGVVLERIEAISLVHKHLYKGANLQEIDLSESAAEIASNLLLGAGRKDIQLQVDATAAPIKTSSAASAVIILNEVITNALKYGFPAGRGGVMHLGIKAENGACEISVQDQGPGMPKEIVASRSFGMTLINALVAELKATIEWIPALPGTLVRIRLPLA